MSSGASGMMQAVEIAMPDGAHQRRAFDQIVARGGEQASFGNRARASGRRGRCAASATAIERGELIWHTRSTVPISIPSSSEAVATSTLISPSFSLRFRRQAQLARQAAVMRGDIVFAQPLAQMMRDALGQAPRVHEHQRRAMLLSTSSAMRS